MTLAEQEYDLRSAVDAELRQQDVARTPANIAKATAAVTRRNAGLLPAYGRKAER